MINEVRLIGNVGQTPELRKTSSGDSVLTLSLATTEAWKDKATGERREETEWHRVVFFNRLAEVVAEYVKKGNALYVEGRNKTREYVVDDVRHKVTEVIASKMKMFPKQKDGTSNQTPQPDNIPVPQQAVPSKIEDDDIPF